jgi:hypothetical protein
MGGLILAWMIGEGLIVWRAVKTEHQPPVPGSMLAASALFALLAIAAEYQPARGAATAFAYGIDIAVLLKVLPGTKAGKPVAGTSGNHPKQPPVTAA